MVYHHQIHLQNTNHGKNDKKNPNSKKGITCTLYNPQVSGTDTDNSFKKF